MRFWGLCFVLLCMTLQLQAQNIGGNDLAGDNPPIYLADGFDMPVGTEAERQSSDLWASDWQSRWSFGLPQNGELSAGIELFVTGSAQRPIYAPASGIVIFAQDVYPFGKTLIIRHDPLFRADVAPVYSRLAGLNELSVAVDNRVERGQMLGESASYLSFALAETAIFEEEPLYQPETASDLEPFLSPYDFIAEARPRTATRISAFSWPIVGEISQSFSETHPALDIDAPEGSPIFATAEGLVIRRFDCRDCERVFPCGERQYQAEDLGFGYGNFLIVRYEAVLMPLALREIMQSYHARYAYLLYAHLGESSVEYGQMVDSQTELGAVGATGCVSAASLHLELRIGSDESVDGRWQEQTALDPFVLFE